MKIKNYLFILLCFFNYVQSENIPIIKDMSWGKVIVEYNGTKKVYKDVKLYPNGVIEWDWNITNTKHRPGIQIADLKDILDFVDEIILSQGYKNMLHVMEETKKFLLENGKTFYIMQSEEAVKLYNELVAQGKKVAIILHSTC